MAPEETRIRSLAALARTLGRSQPLFRLLEAAAEGARTALDAASISVSRLEQGTLDVRTIVNVGDLGPHEVRWPEDELHTIEEFAVLDLAVDRLDIWVADIGDPDCEPGELALLAELDKGCSLGAPVVVDGRLWGEFYATRHRGEPIFGEAERCYAEAMVAILAGAISRSLREESLEQLAFQDPLTGLLNRRALDERATKTFEVPPGVAHTVTALAVDINGLKEVNDSQGHVAGDRLIQSVARALTKHFSRFPGALIARIGGDEFCVLVPRHDPATVIAMGDEVCRKAWNAGPGAGVSCGAATAVLTSERDVTPAELFIAADRAQYAAKRGRLSRTVLAGELPALVEPA